MKLELDDATVPLGGGRRFTVTLKRIDGFDGQVTVTVKNLPPGFLVTSPVVVEPGQLYAQGTIHALPEAAAPAGQVAKAIRVTASAVINAQESVKQVNNLGEVKLGDPPKILAKLSRPGQAAPAMGEPCAEFVIAPGETITATLSIERRNYAQGVRFLNSPHRMNLPHGVFVDNIGLNGVLIPEGQTERTVFITAARYVPESTRKFITVSDKESGQVATWPAVLHVRREKKGE